MLSALRDLSASVIKRYGVGGYFSEKELFSLGLTGLFLRFFFFTVVYKNGLALRPVLFFRNDSVQSARVATSDRCKRKPEPVHRNSVFASRPIQLTVFDSGLAQPLGLKGGAGLNITTSRQKRSALEPVYNTNVVDETRAELVNDLTRYALTF